jgi:hypothetical protein
MKTFDFANISFVLLLVESYVELQSGKVILYVCFWLIQSVSVVSFENWYQ